VSLWSRVGGRRLMQIAFSGREHSIAILIPPGASLSQSTDLSPRVSA
jgi:hypothetical protein